VKEVSVTIGSRSARITPTQRWVIWHVTDECNLECSYCYGSFSGSSYKAAFDETKLLASEVAIRVLSDVEALGFDYVHINGGEPLLHSAIESVLKATLDLDRLRVWLLTNGTVRRQLVERIARGDFNIDRLCFSIDTFDAALGDVVRESTHAVVSMIEFASRVRKVSTRLGAYVVLSTVTIGDFSDTARRLVDLGFDYINLQPVFLPPGHADEHLALGRGDAARIQECYSELESMGVQTSNPDMRALADNTLGGNHGVAVNCFADIGDYLYVSPSGLVYGCPSKPGNVRLAWGSLESRSLADIVARHTNSSETRCDFLCGDCLGMYEMALGPAGTVQTNV